MGCPSSELLAAFDAGELGDDERESLTTHIAGCENCAGVLSTMSPNSSPAAEPSPGTHVGRFVVEGRLGAGGMGVVYAAHDPQLGRKVAVKLLKDPLPRTPARARLLREAQAMARLAHPNVVVVFDAGAVDDRVFVAMELVDGKSLADRLAEKPGWRVVLDLFLQAGRGLAAAHAAGIVHRDFKPANVLVGSDGRARVGDFGLARGAGEAPDSGPASVGSDERLTHSGAVLGTPAYMAPEQKEGATSPLADQYSFCVALYEGLYGERPRGATVPPPARRSPVPARVRRVLLRGLATDPAARWPDMPALLAALGGAARGRRWLWAAGAGAAAVAVAAVLAYPRPRQPVAVPCAGIEQRLYGVWDAERKATMQAGFLATKVPDAAERWRTVERLIDDYAAAWLGKAREVCAATEIRHQQPPDMRARRQTCLDQRLESLRAWVGVMSAPDARAVSVAGGSAAARDNLASCDEQMPFAMPEPEDPVLRAEVDSVRASADALRTRLRVGDYGAAIETAARLRRTAAAFGYKPLAAEMLAVSALLENEIGDPGKAEAFLVEMRRLAEESRYDMLRAGAWVELVWAYVRQNKLAEAHEAARRAEEVLAPLAGVDADWSRAALLQYEGDAFQEEHKLEEARARIEQAVAVMARILNPDDVRLTSVLIAQAGVLLELQRADEAEVVYQRALALTVNVNGERNMTAAGITMNLGNLEMDRGDHAAALALYRKVNATLEDMLGPLNALTNMNLANLAHAMIHVGRADEAMKILPGVLRVLSDARGPKHPLVALTLHMIGEAELARGKPREALAPLEEALALKLGGASHDPNGIAETRFHLAQALVGAGRDRARARQLAIAARDGYDADHAKERSEIETWLANRSGPLMDRHAATK